MLSQQRVAALIRSECARLVVALAHEIPARIVPWRMRFDVCVRGRRHIGGAYPTQKLPFARDRLWPTSVGRHCRGRVTLLLRRKERMTFVRAM